MPIADLLGVRFDMQLLGKLTLSVAAVVLISWAYRFYSSRAQGQSQIDDTIPLPSSTETGPEACSNCTPTLQPQDRATKKESNGESLSARQSSEDFGQEIFEPEKTNAVLKREQPKTCTEDCANNAVENSPSLGEYNVEDCGQYVHEAKYEAEEQIAELTLGAPDQANTPTGSPDGSRSPCVLRKLEGGIEVGRELRQELGHLGTFSMFQSKAEIKMENADLVVDGPGHQNTGVRGKIYDYYVETCSHFVSDLSPTQSLSLTQSLSPTFGPCDAGISFDMQLSGLSSITGRSQSPCPLPSSLLIRDLEPSPEVDMPPVSPIGSEPATFRPALIRKDSYLAAAAHSEVHVPLPPPMIPPLHTHTGEPSTEAPLHSACVSLKETPDDEDESSDEPRVQTVARAKFLNFPRENVGSSELECLTGKLDLGNCLEALVLAKRHGRSDLREAALRVMSDNFFQVLRDTTLYGQLKAGERDHIQRQRMSGKRCLMVADMESPDWSRHLSQLTKSEDVKASSGLYYYDDYKDTWHLQCQIPQEVLSKGCAMCTMDNYLFVATGFQGTGRLAVPSRKVFCYNPMTSIWTEISPMNEARPHCKLVTLQDHVYAIGGECLSTVERYDPRTNRWSFTAPLPNETFAVAHQATACNGELFVSGGTLRYTLLRYNPKTDMWRQSLIVGSKERTTEMVAVRNSVYRFDLSPSMGISVYRYNPMARLWCECYSKRMAHCPAFQCVAMDDIIYCVSRQFTLRFLADDVTPGFVAEDLKVLSAAKGILFPFALALPDKSTLQTRV
ncbi:kelch domain-containing protein 7A [Brachyhypopomus gauderio]|uniref:kelch domain-containing protein 7A n=1 Tax=Brachyhypopomus gauderio TaxID=698409 RepID=UPI004042B7FE